MDDKVEALIGVATAFTAKCKPWFSHFINQAHKIGITDLEISEVIELAKGIRAGAMNQMDQFYLKKLGLEGKAPVTSSSTGCGCSQ